MVLSKTEVTKTQDKESNLSVGEQGAPTDSNRFDALLGKLSRWFERSPLPEPEQLQALFLASPKDEAANQRDDSPARGEARSQTSNEPAKEEL